MRWLICGVVVALGGVPASLCMWFCGSMMAAGDGGCGGSDSTMACGTGCGSDDAGGCEGAGCADDPCEGSAVCSRASARPSGEGPVCRVCRCDCSPCAPEPRTPVPERPRIDVLSEYVVAVGVAGMGAGQGVIRTRVDGGPEGAPRSREHAHRQSVLCVWVI